METRHVGDCCTCNHRLPKIRSLYRDHGHRQTAVTPSKATQSRGLRITLCNEPFARGDEVIEDVLLIGAHAGTMPFFAKLSSPSPVGPRADCAALGEWNHV